MTHYSRSFFVFHTHKKTPFTDGKKQRKRGDRNGGSFFEWEKKKSRAVLAPSFERHRMTGDGQRAR